GLHNAHDTYKKLPPEMGYYPTSTPSGSSVTAFGNTLFHLLPFIEEDVLYKNSVDTSVTTYTYYNTQTLYYTGVNNTQARPVKVYQCPSDPTMPSSGFLPAYSTPPTAIVVVSYAVNAQVFANVNATNFNWVSGAGEPRIPSSFQDGTSKTIVITEREAQ